MTVLKMMFLFLLRRAVILVQLPVYFSAGLSVVDGDRDRRRKTDATAPLMRRETRPEHSREGAFLQQGVAPDYEAAAAARTPRAAASATTVDAIANCAAAPEVMFAMGCFWHAQYAMKHEKTLDQCADQTIKAGLVGSPRADSDPRPITYANDHGNENYVEAVRFHTNTDYGKVLEAFWKHLRNHKQANGQGPDVGKQYAAHIYALSDDQKKVADAFLSEQGPSAVDVIAVVDEAGHRDSKFTFHEVEASQQNHDEPREAAGGTTTATYTITI